MPIISLIGYTNTGKSTLFKQLTNANVYIKNQFFATLDPTFRQLILPNNSRAVLIDTVGFISSLPHELITAFQSTLKESINATLLLHVIDAANAAYDSQINEVHSVLKSIKADNIPQLRIFNKIDMIKEIKPRIERNRKGYPTKIWISAKNGIGIDILLKILVELLSRNHICKLIKLLSTDGEVRAALYRHAEVRSEKITKLGGWLMDVCLSNRRYQQMIKKYPVLSTGENYSP